MNMQHWSNDTDNVKLKHLKEKTGPLQIHMD
jgi:hypothetical protein